MRRLVIALTALLAVATSAALGCSYFHDELPGGSCTTGMDCFKGIEKCDPIAHQCVPNYDAGPVPDAPPVPDAGPDSGIDGGPDGGPDAAFDAAIDAGLPDA